MIIPIFYLDAFTDEKFKGNPIAVCLLSKTLDEKAMQNIAKEIGFSETAFVYSKNNNFIHNNNFDLKWFTPSSEVNLCGHGTLGTASLILEYLNNENNKISFNTLSGTLFAEKKDKYITLDFPLRGFEEYHPNTELLNALSIKDFINSVISKDSETLLIELENILNIRPDFEKLKNINIENIGAVIITQKSNNDDKYDFKSRYFTPWYGINEDPVTGSAHCLLGNYWNKKLNKKEFLAYQASERGGELKVLLDDNFPDRVFIGGQSVLVLKGELFF